ncbi:UPF0426 protein At1g28150 chloroplastic [Euphorbia peplus]|nr:UPF0426 protein At1g28150 chloroplastic [Euphorbia peplus]
MALCVTALTPSKSSTLNFQNLTKTHFPSSFSGLGFRHRLGDSTIQVRAACSFNPIDQPIFKQALKEPVAFMGGMFAGLLRLDLEEEPLKEWVTRTVEASGVTVENADDGERLNPEEVPQQIVIE